MLRLHGHELSGNSNKVRLLLELLGVPDEWVRVDLMQGEHKSQPFLALNPFGLVSVLEEGDLVRWLSTAAGEVGQGPESARLHHRQVALPGYRPMAGIEA